ncbi:MAG: CHAT domain-containing protein [Nostoc sp.]|uniref:CHAT domain-containing protein n=1 Tax=Nostoc sp. TaxID=1180 RepID=UPI002FF59E8C
MSQSDSPSAQNIFNISDSSITNLTGSGSIHYNKEIQGAQTQNSPAASQASTAKTILFLAANPKDTYRLRLDEEMREIEAGLQRAKRRDQFVLQQRWAVRTRDIQRALLDFKPQIVHFSGHGGGEEGLLLEDETGTSKLVNTEALAGLFELFSECLECVVLNACYSKVQTEAIVRHIPYVIGMSQAIGDKAAIEFAVGFYDALGAGESIEFAYKLGCNNIHMAGIPEHLTPVLKNKST